MRRRLLGALAALALGSVAVAVAESGRSKGHTEPARSAAQPTSSTARGPALQELIYRAADGRALAITLRRPATPRALILLVHGGGFRSGNRHAMDGWARLLVTDDYAAATIDYRLAGPNDHDRERSLRRAASDTLAALDRMQRDHSLRRLPVVLWGYSAGALTVLRVASDHPARVRAAVSLAGYGDPRRIRSGNPPMLLFNGTADRAEPVARADATCRAARAAGVTCTQVVYPGVTHALPQTRGPDVHRRARAWLARTLSG